MLFSNCLMTATLIVLGLSIIVRSLFKNDIVKISSHVLIVFSLIFFIILLAFCNDIDADRYKSHLEQRTRLENILKDELPDGIKETVERDLEYEKEAILKYEKFMSINAWELYKNEKEGK